MHTKKTKSAALVQIRFTGQSSVPAGRFPSPKRLRSLNLPPRALTAAPQGLAGGRAQGAGRQVLIGHFKVQRLIRIMPLPLSASRPHAWGTFAWRSLRAAAARDASRAGTRPRAKFPIYLFQAVHMLHSRTTRGNQLERERRRRKEGENRMAAQSSKQRAFCCCCCSRLTSGTARTLRFFISNRHRLIEVPALYRRKQQQRQQQQQ